MNRIVFYLNSGLHSIRSFIHRKYLKNKDVSIICNNCIAGVLYHDLKSQFRSPTINLFFPYAEDYMKYIKNLEAYNSKELVQINSEKPYPVGMLDDIEIHFMHYTSFEEAKNCWDSRKKRINYKNIMVIMTDQCLNSDKVLSDFDKLNYPKVYLTNKHLDYDWSKYISGFDDKNNLGNTIEYSKLGKRYYEQFDFIKFINSIR